MFIDSMKIDTDNIETYNYDLPLERIAEYPLAVRDQSKLLVYKEEKISHHVFTSIAAHLPSNALLVFNNTRVVQARFLFQTQTGAALEIFSLEPAEGGPAESMSAKGPVVWKCFVGNAKRWKQPLLERTVILPTNETLIFHAKQIEKKEDYYIIEFSWNVTHITFSEIFSLLGDLPLPPYMKRKTEDSDKVRYQTIYAKHEGSVAAPTAGLHFTENVFDALQDNGIQRKEVTLHVGAGTFKPVKTDSINDHSMHGEHISVSREIIEYLYQHGEESFIVPVGTTSMRTLESLYWLGCKLTEVFTGLPELLQWDAYSVKPLSLIASMKNILSYLDKHNFTVFSAKTSLLIKPGYEFKVCKALVTNFHQPKSTLLCLVASFIGIEPMKRIYDAALGGEYRFLSYGDSSLLFGKASSSDL
jgi:S-adenosylmethionine:tRNA ribosyltransferase-isomerase